MFAHPSGALKVAAGEDRDPQDGGHGRQHEHDGRARGVEPRDRDGRDVVEGRERERPRRGVDDRPDELPEERRWIFWRFPFE
jgi:hypothetical protein